MEEAFRINQRKSRKAKKRRRCKCCSLSRANENLRLFRKVQGTNDSSILSKVSMVKLGYFDDVFLREFVDKDARRSPSINRSVLDRRRESFSNSLLIPRGYYIRMKALEYAFDMFYSTYGERDVQVNIPILDHST